jgi:hypothetical protein
MNNSQRASQFWAVLVLAARNRQVLTYGMMEKATGIPRFGQATILALIVAYCDSRRFPKLTTILVGDTDGLPADGVDDPATVCAEHARVFAFDWLKERAPSPQGFETMSSSKA